MSSKEVLQLKNIVEDLVGSLLWDDREEDEDMVLSGVVTKDFILQTFKTELYKELPEVLNE